MNSLEEPAINETSILQSINTKTSEENVEVKHLDQAYVYGFAHHCAAYLWQ